jgi:hypothetical protein
MNQTTLNPMRNISPHPDGWLVRFERRKKLYQKFFRDQRLEQAKRWRDAMERSLCKAGCTISPNLRTFKHPNCKDENKKLPIGASYNRQKKELAQGGYTEQLFIQMTYQMFNEHNERKVRTRRFYVGIVDQYDESTHQKALTTIHEFSKEYRYCSANRLPFYPKKYNGWKNKQLHLIPLEERALIEVGQPEKVHKS